MSNTRLHQRISNLVFNNVTKNLIDALVGAVALFLAFEARFEGMLPGAHREQMLLLIGPFAAAHVALIWAFGLGRQKWRYVTRTEAVRLASSQLILTIVGYILRFTLPPTSVLHLTTGVLTLEYFLFVSGALAIRIGWRTVLEKEGIFSGAKERRKILIIGAGFHGLTVALEMRRHKTIQVVGFLDDDPSKHGLRIAGARVLGPISMLPQVTKTLGEPEVLVCVPPSERAALNMGKAGTKVRMRIMPTAQELIDSEPQLEEAPRKLNVALHRSSHAVPFPPLEHNIEGQTILITGGAGFIASNFAEKLVNKNKLVLFDRTFEKKPLRFSRLAEHPNVRLVEGDILDDSDIAKVCSGVDMVVHMAAVLGVGKVCSAGRETLETNYVGTSRLLHALELNSRLVRFVYFSTSEVFGVNSYRVGELTPPMVGPIAEARWSYSMAKLAGEHLVQSYFRELKMPTVIVRPFNVFGPRRTGDYALLRFIVNALANRPLQIHGDGSQIRSWCFVEDFCDALVSILERPVAVGEDFNIGNPSNTITVKDLARRVIDLSGSSSSVRCIENPFPDIQIRVPSLDKSQKLLGYNPRYDLDRALSLTIDWHRDHWDFFSSMVLPQYEETRQPRESLASA